MGHCSVPNCFEIGKKATCFSVPCEPKRVREKWLGFLRKTGKDVLENVKYRICEKHFKKSEISFNKSRKVLKKRAFPSILKHPAHRTGVYREEEPVVQVELRKAVCSMPKCGSRSKDGIAVFAMPKHNKMNLQNKWKALVGTLLKNMNKKDYPVCELHFFPTDVTIGPTGKILRNGSFPLISDEETNETGRPLELIISGSETLNVPSLSPLRLKSSSYEPCTSTSPNKSESWQLIAKIKKNSSVLLRKLEKADELKKFPQVVHHPKVVNQPQVFNRPQVDSSRTLANNILKNSPHQRTPLVLHESAKYSFKSVNETFKCPGQGIEMFAMNRLNIKIPEQPANKTKPEEYVECLVQEDSDEPEEFVEFLIKEEPEDHIECVLKQEPKNHVECVLNEEPEEFVECLVKGDPEEPKDYVECLVKEEPADFDPSSVLVMKIKEEPIEVDPCENLVVNIKEELIEYPHDETTFKDEPVEENPLEAFVMNVIEETTEYIPPAPIFLMEVDEVHLRESSENSKKILSLVERIKQRSGHQKNLEKFNKKEKQVVFTVPILALSCTSCGKDFARHRVLHEKQKKKLKRMSLDDTEYCDRCYRVQLEIGRKRNAELKDHNDTPPIDYDQIRNQILMISATDIKPEQLPQSDDEFETFFRDDESGAKPPNPPSSSTQSTSNDRKRKNLGSIRTEDSQFDLELSECHLCKESFPQKWQLSEHLASVHRIDLTQSRLCFECGKEFVNAEQMRRHAKRAHESSDDPRICNTCGKVFFGSERFFRHMRTHTAVSKKCEICGMFVKKMYMHMKRHRDAEEAGNEVACKLCGYAVKRTKMNKHMHDVHGGSSSDES